MRLSVSIKVAWARLLVRLLKSLAKSPIAGSYFKGLLAAAAVGSGCRALREKRYDYAFRVFGQFEDDEIDNACVATCQWHLGVLYFYGYGVPKDEEKAVSIFQRAASAGNPDAIDYMKRRAAYLRAGHSNHSLQPTGFAGG